MILKITKHVSRLIELSQYWMSLLIISFLTLATCLQIFRRFVLNSPIPWLQEISLCLLIWLVFLGAGVLVKRNQHIRVDIVYAKFSDTVKRVIDILLDLLVLIFSTILFYLGLDLYVLQSPIPFGVLELPRSIYYAIPLLVFAFSLFIYSFEKLIISIFVPEENTIWE